MTNLVLSISTAAAKPAWGMLVIFGLLFLGICVGGWYLAMWFFKVIKQIKNRPDDI